MQISPISTVKFKGQPQNYSIIDRTISRSAQPTEEEFLWLKEQGVTDVINFRTLFRSKPEFDEQELVEGLGMHYHNIPSKTRQPEISNLYIFLDIVRGIKRRGGKALIHCKAGADRTGMYSFVYKTLNGIGSAVDNEKEWLARGHHQRTFPNLIPETKEMLAKIAHK